MLGPTPRLTHGGSPLSSPRGGADAGPSTPILNIPTFFCTAHLHSTTIKRMIATMSEKKRHKTLLRPHALQGSSSASSPPPPPNPYSASTTRLARLDHLATWLNDLTGAPQPSVLEPIALSPANIGLAATHPIPANTPLVSIPKAALMTLATATGSPFCGALIEAHDLSSWQAMCLHLLTERAAGPASRWHAYIATLPNEDDLSTHPLLWRDDDLALLQGSPTLDRLTARIANVREDTDALLAAGANDLPIAKEICTSTSTTGTTTSAPPPPPPLTPPLVTERSVRWAAATLLSRAFYLVMEEGEGGAFRVTPNGYVVDPTLPPDRARPGQADVGALLDDDVAAGDEDYFGSYDGDTPPSVVLVPWADVLNHASDATEDALLIYDPDLQCATLRSHRPYEVGDQVFDSYGPWKSPGDLLLDYGFVDPDNANVWVEVPLARLVRPVGEAARGFFAAAGGMLEELGAILDAESPPDVSILAWARAASATDDELISLGWDAEGDDWDLLGAAMLLTESLETPISVENETRMMDGLIGALEEVLGGYRQDAAADEEELAQLERRGEKGDGESRDGIRMAVLRTVLTEKVALEATLARMRAMRGRIMEGGVQ